MDYLMLVKVMLFLEVTLSLKVDFNHQQLLILWSEADQHSNTQDPFF